jgi:hypothetical protein
MAQPVSVPVAARALGCSPETLRRWIRESGCPAILGGRGRGKGARVDVDVARAWRDQRSTSAQEFALKEYAKLALDFHRRGAEASEPGWRVLGIPEGRAAALLACLLDYMSVRLAGGRLETAETALLVAIARQNVHTLTDSVERPDGPID